MHNNILPSESIAFNPSHLTHLSSPTSKQVNKKTDSVRANVELERSLLLSSSKNKKLQRAVEISKGHGGIWKPLLSTLTTSLKKPALLNYIQSLSLDQAKTVCLQFHQFQSSHPLNDQLDPLNSELVLSVIKNNHLELLDLLLISGYPHQVSDNQSKKALMKAVEAGNTQIVKKLISAGVNPQIVDTQGRTPLLLAAQKGDTAMARVLIQEVPSQVEVTNKKGNTVLLVALIHGNIELIKLLIHEAHADIQACNHDGYTALCLALSQGDPAMIDLLKLPQSDHEYAEEFLRRKQLAHIWGVKGNSLLMNKTKGTLRIFPLEGMYPSAALQLLSTYVQFFFQSADMNMMLSKEARENIKSCISGSISTLSAPSFPPAEILAKINEGHPIFILGGITGHAISILICKKKFKHQIIVCNRGLGMSDHAVEFYSLSASKINEQLIRDLRKIHKNTNTFNQMIADLGLTRIVEKGVHQKPQKVGNCSWASSKSAFRMLCECYTDRDTSRVIYKKFSRDFVREKALQDYLEQTHEPDRELLQKIKQKYINEKHNIILSEKILEQLDRTCETTE